MNLKETYRLECSKLKEAGITTSELDARMIICGALEITHEKFILMLVDKTELSPAVLKKINLNINKRAQNIPVAYILGHKDFFGLDFKVDENVLIPRSETEYLVELALKKIKKDSKVLDMGTGCGNIIISITKNSDATFYASDISDEALKVAKQNAKSNKVSIKFIKSDLFENIKDKNFDIIVANLPYVPKKVESKKLKVERIESISFEPQNAIFAEDNGADIIKRFLVQSPKYLNDDGMILIELDPRNAKDIKKFALDIFPRKKIRLEKDLAGFLRYLVKTEG